MQDVTYPLAFLAGVLSFVSPCVLPLIPSYLTFITGMSFEQLTVQGSKEEAARVRALTITNSLTFIAGFSTVFIALGASSSFLGQILFDYQDWVRIVGGILIIIFGLFIAGAVRLDFLMQERKFHLQGRPAGYVGTYLIGMAFAAGWTPCIGPILGSILLVASSEGSTIYGIKLLSLYSMGLGLPLFLSALGFNTFLSYSRALKRYMKWIMLVSGIVLIAFGILMLTNNVRWLSGLLPYWEINLSPPS